MKRFQPIVCAGILILTLSVSTLAKPGTISTTKSGTISTTGTGTISTTRTGTISTTVAGTISTTRIDRSPTMPASALIDSNQALVEILLSVLRIW